MINITLELKAEPNAATVNVLFGRPVGLPYLKHFVEVIGRVILALEDFEKIDKQPATTPEKAPPADPAEKGVVRSTQGDGAEKGPGETNGSAKPRPAIRTD